MNKNIRLSYQLNTFTVFIFVLTSLVSVDLRAETEIEHKNSVFLFLGNTQNGSLTGASIGLGYERRLTKLIGLGGSVEHAGGDIDATTVNVDLHIHPHAGWDFLISPGVGFEGGDQHTVFRTGVAYEFEVVPRWILAPEFNVNFVDGEQELIYGLSTKFEF